MKPLEKQAVSTCNTHTHVHIQNQHFLSIINTKQRKRILKNMNSELKAFHRSSFYFFTIYNLKQAIYLEQKIKTINTINVKKKPILILQNHTIRKLKMRHRN